MSGGGGSSGGGGRYPRANCSARRSAAPPIHSAISRICWYSSSRRTSSARGSSQPSSSEPPGQQHLRLEPHQPAGHVEVVGRLVEAQLVDGLEKLIGDAGDRNVGDLELLFAQQVQQQIERPGEGVELHHERGPGAKRRGRRLG